MSVHKDVYNVSYNTPDVVTFLNPSIRIQGPSKIHVPTVGSESVHTNDRLDQYKKGGNAVIVVSLLENDIGLQANATSL